MTLALNFHGKCRNTIQMQMAVSSLRSWRDSCARGTFLAAEPPQKACGKAEGKSQSSQSSAAKNNAALLLILSATQARPYVRRKIVEMQKCCSQTEPKQFFLRETVGPNVATKLNQNSFFCVKRLVPIEHDDLTGRDKECFVEEMTLWPVICRSALVSNYAKRRYDADPMPQKHTYIPFI